MTPRDLTDLPHPVRDALLRLLDAIQQHMPTTPPVTPPGESSTPGRFPRQALEILLLETLEANAPMPFSPFQLSELLGQPQLEVRNTLHALAVLGTITHVRAGYYSHGQGVPGQTTRKQRDDRREPSPPRPPSARYAAQIARIVATQDGTPPAGGEEH